LDTFVSFEETLRQTAPVLLAGPGIVLVALGLFLWPGGLRFLKPLAAFWAAVAGLACAWFWTDRSLAAMLMLGLIPAVIGVFLDKPVVVVLGATLAMGAVLAWPAVTDAAFREAVSEEGPAYPAADEGAVLEPSEYVQRIIQWGCGWAQAFWRHVSDLQKVAAAGAAVVVLVLGVFAWRWICALTCAALGTIMILGGICLLVLSKGPQTIPYIQGKLPFLWPMTGVMIVAGTVLNRWLCPAKPKPQKQTEHHSAQGGQK
jgi:hypothetical protein